MVAIRTMFCSITPLVFVIMPLFYVIKSNPIGNVHVALGTFFLLVYRNIMRLTIHYTIEITLLPRVTTAVVSHPVKRSSYQMSCRVSSIFKNVQIGSGYSFVKLSHLLWCCVPNEQFFLTI
jgi:hypothetical protein